MTAKTKAQPANPAALAAEADRLRSKAYFAWLDDRNAQAKKWNRQADALNRRARALTPNA
jgi:hypothetical protein